MLDEPSTPVIELAATSLSDGPVIDDVIAPDGATRAIARPYSVTLVDVPSGTTRWRTELIAALPRLAFSRDGSRLAVLGLDHEASFAVLDARTGAVQSSAALYIPGVPAPRGSRMGYVSFGAHAVVPNADDTGFDLLGSRRAPIVIADLGRASIDVSRATPLDTIGGRPRPELAWDRLDVSDDEQILARTTDTSLEWIDPRGTATSCDLSTLGIARIAGVGFESRRAWLFARAGDDASGELVALTRGTCDVEERRPAAGLPQAMWLDEQRAFLGLDAERLVEIAIDRPLVAREIAGTARNVEIAREGDGYVVFSGEWARARAADGAVLHAHVANPVHSEGVVCGGRALLGTRLRAVIVRLPEMTPELVLDSTIEWAACSGDRWIVGRGASPALLLDAREHVALAQLSFPEARGPQRSSNVRWLASTNELVFTAGNRVWRVTLPAN